MRWLPLLPLLALAACTNPLGSDDDGVALIVDPKPYARGETVSGELLNESGESIGYNLCFSSFQRREGRSWTTGSSLYGVGCTTVQFGLSPGRSEPFAAELPIGMLPGQYRLVTEIENRDGRHPEVSNVFRVR